MYLKSIEVQGFKSFANKIVFEFHNGITGIVGPNGSGKSNVADAVRWVLGEQSARQLRGANMQDIIFSGTENRRPLAYAYVAITLDNADHKLAIDFKEVTVARKVYRSGESEYLINGSACRLKDVQELFYDTGIGKEGYSIIGQGQIDRILSSKPEERRELFDEAAGIVKFKRRKKAAQKNLENEHANLVRISDILSELEKQIGPLEKQAEKAKHYLKKKEELKAYDVNLFLMETGRVKQQLKELEDKIAVVYAELKDTKQQYETTRTGYEELQDKTGHVEHQIEETRNALNQASVLSQRLEGEINVLKEQVRSAREAAQRIEERRQSVLSEIAGRTEEKEELEEEHLRLKQQLDAMKQQNQEDQNQLAQLQKNIQDYSDRIEDAKSRMIQMMNDKAAVQGNQQRYDTMLEQVQLRKTELNQRLLTMKVSEDEQKSAAARYEKELKSISDRLSNELEKEKRLQLQEKEWRDARRQQSDRLQELQREYHQDQSRLDSLVNITERYDGYGSAIRKVMEQKEKNKGIIGVVADIIKVEKKYETAIETALGGNIQNIVTDTEQTAKIMIEYLKKNHFGRATFLPLSSVNSRGSFSREKALREQGAIGTADTLVQTKEVYRGLLAYLLSKTLVVDTMEHAIVIARLYKHSIRIVTLEGELLNPGGSMTGGAFKNSSNLLGRRREMEELAQKVSALKKEMQLSEQQLHKQKQQLEENQRQQQELSAQLQKTYLAQNTAKMNWSQANEKMEETGKGYRDLLDEGTEMESQILSIGYQKKQIHEEVMRIQNKVEELDRQIDQWQAELEEERKFEERISSQLSEKQIGWAGLQQTHNNIQQNIQRLRDEILKFRRELGQLEEEGAEADNETRKKEEDIAGQKEAYRVSEEEKRKMAEQLDQLTVEKEKLAKDNQEFLSRREKLLEQKSDLDKEHMRLEGQKEKLEESQESSINHMWEEYELTYSSAAALRDEQYSDANALNRLIRQTRGEIHNLGDVNVNAIEDYKNVSERYEFLDNQRKDLLEAEQTLSNIIVELDEGMRRQFRERFEEIRAEFDKVFKELFGGGKAALELEEDVDILEAGIRIHSQPPGKKLGSIMQMSGGEKALTAIALLFAIQNLKPSPFCLLDEIEAALDDSNVTRYARYLHKLTRHTQFIIITHRRGTMAAADRLYGITMQEKGVSTLVSVNLMEEELEL